MSMTNTRSVEIGLPRTAWVKGQSSAHWCLAILFAYAQWDLAFLPDCKCGAVEQTADHVLKACPTACIEHDMEYMVRWFLIMKPDAGSSPSLSDPGNATAWGSKRINP